MPILELAASRIYYEEHGSGFPLLLFAPGGMSSTVDLWSRAAINPLEAYVDHFRLIALDQRNAGRSTGAFDVADPWGSMVADPLALLDHLGIDRFGVMGCCIGGSYALKIIEQAPERVVAAVLQQPIGIIPENRQIFDGIWKSWAGALVQQRDDLDAGVVEEFANRMWEGDFVVSVSQQFVETCATPILVLPGVDDHHPTITGRQIARLAPRGHLLEPWKDPEHLEEATKAVGQFLLSHT